MTVSGAPCDGFACRFTGPGRRRRAEIVSAAAETANAIHARLEAALQDLPLPPPEIIIMDRSAIEAAADLERANAQLAEADATFATAATAQVTILANRRTALEDRDRRSSTAAPPATPTPAMAWSWR